MIKKITVVSRILLSLLLVFSLCLPVGAFVVGAEGEASKADSATVELTYDVHYGQTEARTMLEMVNAFRTSPTDAWYWASNNTDKVIYDGTDRPLLEELVYDYTLEEVAMLRAAEIASKWSHERPNGESYFTAYPVDENGNQIYSAKGENIVTGTDLSAEGAYMMWREDACNYADQGHRRNMLSSSFNSVGIGHCTVNGVDYWVQNFGYLDSEGEPVTSACDAVTSITVEVEKSYISFSDVEYSSVDTTMEIGTSQNVPTVTARYTMAESNPKNFSISVDVPAVWVSSNPEVVSVVSPSSTDAGIVLVAGKPGTAIISTEFEPLVSAADAPESLSFTVTVSPINISGSDIVLEYTEIEYTGKENKPAVKGLTINGKPLPVSSSDFTVSSTDFIVSYSDIVNVGTGKVTVTAKGTNYTGTTTGTFTIKPCQHTYDDGAVKKAATCTADGEKLFTCTKCRESKIEAIKATGHTPGAAATCTADQKCSVCDAVVTKATGHTPVSGSFDCTADQTCSVCGEAYHKAGQHTPGDAATCTAAQKCTVCDKVIKQATGHTPGSAATCTADQKCTVCKAVIKKATGHSPGAAPTCGTPQKCNVCGAVVSKATGKHNDANNDQKCDVCGADTSGKGPVTGEIIRSNLPVIIAFAAVIISAVVIIVISVKRRSSKKSD